MILTLTGHRPKKMPWKYNLRDKQFKRYRNAVMAFYMKNNPSLINSGMAIGHDMWCTYIAFKMGIPYNAYVPFKGQENLWSDKDKKTYHFLLENANNVFIESDVFDKQAYLIRDEKMVDNCDKVLAYYNGTRGGTKHTYDYAISKKKPIINLYEELLC